MTRVITDEDLDRAVSSRLASQYPLPRAVALNADAAYFGLRLRYTLLGIDGSATVRDILTSHLDAGTAAAISSAQYADRLAHVTASLGMDPCPMFDLRTGFDWAALGRAGGDPVPKAGGEPVRP